MEKDIIYRQDAIDALDCLNGVEEVLRSLPSVHPDYICLDRQSILNAGYTGTEYKFRIGGRVFAVRELAQ